VSLLDIFNTDDPRLNIYFNVMEDSISRVLRKKYGYNDSRRRVGVCGCTVYICVCVFERIYIQGVPGGMCQTSGGCSLC
jgi:hypothetical protein